ncbi:MAG: M20/M25/M40 family metallo-hydrolase [Candidatus Thorarchaeota archaeon]
MELKIALWSYWLIFFLLLIPASAEASTLAETLPSQQSLNAYERPEPNSEDNCLLKSFRESVQSEPKPLWGTVYEEVSETSYYNFVYSLSAGFGPRPHGSEANDRAIRWIESSMLSLSEDAATVEIWGEEYASVVGILEGYDPSLLDIIVIGGHMDTVPPSPGADDNASGTALVLEALRVLGQYQFPRDIYFCAFNAEENGLLGSQEVATILSQSGTLVKMMFNADMILYDPQGSGERVYIYSTNQEEYTAAELVRNFSRSYGDDVFSLSSGGAGGSDHMSFRNAGYNAIFSIETNFGSNPYYHQSTDTVFQEEYNFTLAAEVTAAFAAAVAKLSFEGISPTIDFDNDSLTDLVELELGTNPANPDTDNDGLFDGEEVNIYLTDPLERDSDNDNLYDGEEIKSYQTNPLIPDSDGDGLDDGQEVIFWNTDPLSSDTDRDGLNDSAEVMIYHTSPIKADSDADGLSDGQEIQRGTDPGLRDSDGDLIPDGEEVEKGWNPLDPENPGDTRTPKSSSSSSGFTFTILLLSLLAVIFYHRKSGVFKRLTKYSRHGL